LTHLNDDEDNSDATSGTAAQATFKADGKTFKVFTEERNSIWQTRSLIRTTLHKPTGIVDAVK
jgi:hypothetical protein